MVTPVCGFFFSRRVLSAQPVSSAYPIELTDTDRETEVLGHKALHSRTGDKRMTLAIVQHPGENLPAELDGVPMSPLSQRLLTFAFDTLEQPIHSCTMQRDRAEPSCLCGSHSLLHVPDNLPPDELSSLALVWCHSKWHSHHLSLLFHSALGVYRSHCYQIRLNPDLQHPTLETSPQPWNNSMQDRLQKKLARRCPSHMVWAEMPKE